MVSLIFVSSGTCIPWVTLLPDSAEWRGDMEGTGALGPWNTVWRVVTELYITNMASAMFVKAVFINWRWTSCGGVEMEGTGGIEGVWVLQLIFLGGYRSFTPGDDLLCNLGGSSRCLPELEDFLLCNLGGLSLFLPELRELLTEQGEWRLFSVFLSDEKLSSL